MCHGALVDFCSSKYHSLSVFCLHEKQFGVVRPQLPLPLLQTWIEEQRELSQGMVDMALYQYSAEGGSVLGGGNGDKRSDGSSALGDGGKLDLAQFANFVSLEGSIQGLLSMLPQVLDV